ncbi:hypothetical protein [Nocardia vaccinii]|uniref:hypothetical protein n=1 Tax=Nocardia vaccinii TaxID=1822 RepID=UPI00082965DE|nr:hypothetical protein [Nocardia vaccinii]
MNAPWGNESPELEAKRKLPPPAVQLLEQIHALAAAGTAITHDLADSAWPAATVALWHKDLQRLDQRCAAAEQQAQAAGVPHELVAMAWFAGHCDAEWTPRQADPTLGLRPVLGAELMASAGQLHNMAAVLVSHEFAPGSRLPRDPFEANQLTRNMAAMFKRAAMLANLIGVSEAGWESLWDLPPTAQREYLTAFLGPDAQQDLEWAWNQYTSTDGETTTLHTIEQLKHRAGHLPNPGSPNPRSVYGAEHAKAAALRTYRNALHQLHEHLATAAGPESAVDAAFPQGTDRGWEPDNHTSGSAERQTDPTAEVEP